MTREDAVRIAALDELNRAVRARGLLRAPRTPVYAYKRHVLEMLARAGALICTPIEVSVACRTCGGSGEYHDDDYRERCRRCSASGRVRLRFTVSELPDGQRWHTPHGGCADHALLRWAWGPLTWHEGLNCYVASLPDGSQKPVRYEPVFDWRPGEEVKLDLTADRIAELLNIVEAGLPPWIGYRDLERVMFGYRLDAGHGLGATCWHCGEPCPDEAPRYGIGSFGHEWLTWSVRTHHYCRPAETKWPAVPPEEALTPNIRAWLARRDGLLRIRSDG